MVERTKWAAFFGSATIVAVITLIAFLRLMELLRIPGPLLLLLGLLVFTLVWSYDALTERK